MLQPVCDGAFEEQLAVIQDQEDSEAAVLVQTTGKRRIPKLQLDQTVI